MRFLFIYFKLIGKWSKWLFSSSLQAQRNSVRFIIKRKTVATIIFSSIWKQSEETFSEWGKLHSRLEIFYVSRHNEGPMEGPPQSLQIHTTYDAQGGVLGGPELAPHNAELCNAWWLQSFHREIILRRKKIERVWSHERLT